MDNIGDTNITTDINEYAGKRTIYDRVMLARRNHHQLNVLIITQQAQKCISKTKAKQKKLRQTAKSKNKAEWPSLSSRFHGSQINLQT